MKGSIIISLCFIVGALVGNSGVVAETFDIDNLTYLALLLLVFLVGISIGGSSDNLKLIRKNSVKALLIPLSTAIGTLIGAAFISLFLTYSIKECMAVGAGFGYYSLSSIIIKNIYSQNLGVIALLSNIIREIITLVFAPVIVALFGKMSIISSGGATSMDTTLPIVIRHAGKQFAMISVLNGVSLTIIVPIIIELIL